MCCHVAFLQLKTWLLVPLNKKSIPWEALQEKAAMKNRRAEPPFNQLTSACTEFNARQSRRCDGKGGSQGGVPDVTEKLDHRPCQDPPPKTSADHLLTEKTLTAARGLLPRTHVLGRLGTHFYTCLFIDRFFSFQQLQRNVCFIIFSRHS